MRRTIFRVIKNPCATTKKESRMAIVDFHDEFGMLKLDIPVLPRGTVIETEPSSFSGEKEEKWEVVDYEPYGVCNEKKDVKLSYIKDIANFYKMTKTIIPTKDFYAICKAYPGNLCFYYKENPYFMFSPSFFSDEAIKNFEINPENIARVSVPRTFEERRQEIASFINYELVLTERAGNTGMPYEKLLAKVKNRLELVGHILNANDPDEESNFSAFINYSNLFLNKYDSSCRFFMDTTNFTSQSLVFRRATYDLENTIYQKVKQLLNTPCSIVADDEKYEDLSDDQNEAVNNVFSDGNICIITGGPGTGKTTVIKKIIDKALTKMPGIKIKVVAPTGSASKRAKEAIGFVSSDVAISTIHRLVGFGKDSEASENGENAVKEASLIIIDEGSMLPLNVFKTLLEQMDPTKTKIVLIGDKDQLPSVDAGNILVDLINLGIPTYYLKDNFRSVGNIVEFANKINNKILDASMMHKISSIDEVPDSPGVYFIDISSKQETEIEEDVSQFAFTKEENGDSWTVLSARKQGSLAANALNMVIAKKLRSHRTEHKYVYEYEAEDRVIALRTNYSVSDNNCYYNGDVGKIIDGSYEKNEIVYVVKLDGENSDTFVKSSDLSLAYNLTIHKSQGREYKTVGLIVPDDNFMSKKLLYTGVTRAKESIVIWSTTDALQHAINRNYDEFRTTLLSVMPKLR